jgi:hypothetical protein
VARRDVRGALLRCVCPGKRGFGHSGHPADRPFSALSHGLGVRAALRGRSSLRGRVMARPGFLEAEARRAEFARLVAEDLRMGGLDQAAANVVRNARSARLSFAVTPGSVA